MLSGPAYLDEPEGIHNDVRGNCNQVVQPRDGARLQERH